MFFLASVGTGGCNCASLCPVEYPVWDAFDRLCLKHLRRGERCYIDWNTGTDGDVCHHPHRLKYQKEEGVKPCVYYPGTSVPYPTISTGKKIC